MEGIRLRSSVSEVPTSLLFLFELTPHSLPLTATLSSSMARQARKYYDTIQKGRQKHRNDYQEDDSTLISRKIIIQCSSRSVGFARALSHSLCFVCIAVAVFAGAVPGVLFLFFRTISWSQLPTSANCVFVLSWALRVCVFATMTS